MKIIRKLLYPITTVVIIVIILVIIYTKENLKSNAYENIIVENEIVKEETSIIETEELYTIDIKGAIKNPGVYTVEKTCNVNDQTTPNMIQKLNHLFARKPLILKGI